MKVNNNNNVNNVQNVNSPQIDEEVYSRQTPTPIRSTGLQKADVTGSTRRQSQLGADSRANLDGLRVRDQVASALTGNKSASATAIKTDAVATPTTLTNTRFSSEPGLQAVLQGSALPTRGEGVKRVQQTLMDLGFAVRGGADGAYGVGTRSAIQQFQREQGLIVNGQIDKATLLMLDKVAPAMGETAKLQNGRFAGDTRLQEILMGGKTLTKVDNGDIVKKVQQALKDMGYNGPLYGVDGALGGETARLIKSFQRAQNLPITGQVDRATLRELDRLSPAAGQKLEKFPEYDRLFADGVLTTTFAVGYDEENWHNIEAPKLRSQLSQDGYHLLDKNKTADADVLKKAGYDLNSLPEGVTFFTKQFNYKGKTVDSLVQLVTPDTPEAVGKFEQALANSDMTIYMGHARYGTGPDFDAKESTKGNYVIGVNSAAHQAGKAKAGYDAHMNEILKDSQNSLEKTEFSKERYQIWAFYACKTVNYADEMRVVPKNKDEKNLDVIGSNELIYWQNMAASGMATLRAITNGKSINNLEADLYNIHQIENGFYTDGFGDNA